MNTISLSVGRQYFFQQNMKNVLAIKDENPLEVHRKLILMIDHVFKNYPPEFKSIADHFTPGLALNTRDFYFDDHFLLNEIMNLYKTNNITPTIHQMNDSQPIGNCPDFINELKRNIYWVEQGFSPNICVHLPVRKKDDTNEVISCLTSTELLDFLKSRPEISIDLENNHHNSFFGNLYNCADLMLGLRDKLEESGYKEQYDNFNLTFDFGHFATQSYFMHYNMREMLDDFFSDMKSKINTLHIHNNDGRHKDQHILMGIKPQKGSDGKYYAGGKEIDKDRFNENRDLFLEMLPILDWKEKNRSNIVLEISSPYKVQELVKFVASLFENM